MMGNVYFDSCVFISIFKPEKERALKVRALLRELKRDNTRIHTSILSIQESSVLAFRRGAASPDYHGRINSFASIHTITKSIAIRAAQLEAIITKDIDPQLQDKHRRKWDCFHIATAELLGCTAIYTWDGPMLNRAQQLNLATLRFLSPEPTVPEFDFNAGKLKGKRKRQPSLSLA